MGRDRMLCSQSFGGMSGRYICQFFRESTIIISGRVMIKNCRYEPLTAVRFKKTGGNLGRMFLRCALGNKKIISRALSVMITITKYRIIQASLQFFFIEKLFT